MSEQARWPDFHASELKCRCGQCDSDGREMDPVFMTLLQRLRQVYGKPMFLNSAYRCSKHPNERNKAVHGDAVGRTPSRFCTWP